MPSEDVCLEHCEPLVCKHGCENAKKHQCKEREGVGDEQEEKVDG